MQLRTYAKKNGLTAVDVIEALKLDNPNVDWVLTSALEPSELVHLDTHFGLNKPDTKQPLQLPGSTSEIDRVQPNGELIDHLQANATKLTASDVEELKDTVQTSIIEERAELAAIRDFQTYQATYDNTKRSLIVGDIYQKLDERNNRRKQFEEQQIQLSIQQNSQQTSSDLMTDMLNILKADKYKSDFLTSKLEQI